MKIIHTSDWHLGQHFMGKTRQAEHQAFLAWLIAQVVEYQVDAVIIAGDIFDTGTPPSYAREMYNEFIGDLHDVGAKLVILGGNHDSVAVLGESKNILSRLSTIVIPSVAETIDQQLIVLENRQGQPAALLCGIPFIRARDVMQSVAGQNAQEKQLTLQEAILNHYQKLFQLAEAKRSELGSPLPIIATGHLTTVGASASESVREIYVGSLEAFPTAAFPPADYIALGHIHRPQKVGGLDHIRYCGSPIPLSFDEIGKPKEVLLVELNEQGLKEITPLLVPCFQPLVTIKGNLTELERQIAEVAKLGTPATPVWLEVTVKGDDYLSDLQPRIEAICEQFPVEVLRIRRDRSESVARLQAFDKETLSELTTLDVFEKRLAQEELDPETLEQLHVRYRSVIERLHGDVQ
ncbi:MAG: exonuclease subunit SbcD [Gammaproteobacteria bacterium]|nr:exonuclease subunit SbcD [Gammaproteobacteria bacterium]